MPSLEEAVQLSKSADGPIRDQVKYLLLSHNVKDGLKAAVTALTGGR